MWHTLTHVPVQNRPGQLYLGGYWGYAGEKSSEPFYASIQNRELNQRNVTCIISLGFETSPFAFLEGGGRTCYAYNVEDSTHEDTKREMRNILGSIADMIDVHLQSGNNVYIHCHAGISRSPTAVIHYLCRHHQKKPLDALVELLDIRSCVHPNPAFMSLLYEMHQ